VPLFSSRFTTVNSDLTTLPVTYVGQDSYHRALQAAGVACEAVDMVMGTPGEDNAAVNSAFAITRPHGGFVPREGNTGEREGCSVRGTGGLLNNVAVAMAHARVTYPWIIKIAVIESGRDLAHEAPSVLHAMYLGDDETLVLHIGMPDFTEQLQAFQPALIVVSAHFKSHESPTQAYHALQGLLQATSTDPGLQGTRIVSLYETSIFEPMPTSQPPRAGPGGPGGGSKKQIANSTASLANERKSVLSHLAALLGTAALSDDAALDTVVQCDLSEKHRGEHATKARSKATYTPPVEVESKGEGENEWRLLRIPLCRFLFLFKPLEEIADSVEVGLGGAEAVRLWLDTEHRVDRARIPLQGLLSSSTSRNNKKGITQREWTRLHSPEGREEVDLKLPILLPYYHIWTCNPRFYSSYRSTSSCGSTRARSSGTASS